MVGKISYNLRVLNRVRVRVRVIRVEGRKGEKRNPPLQ